MESNKIPFETGTKWDLIATTVSLQEIERVGWWMSAYFSCKYFVMMSLDPSM